MDLRRRLALLAPRDPARSEVIARAAEAYGVSVWTIYRALRELTRPKSVRRSDHGSTRAAPAATMERYAEIVAALKIRTTNKKGRHLSTARAIRLLEEDGVETPDGLVQAPVGLLKRATVDRVLRASGLDHARVSHPVAAVRFQAKRANELWHFDMSPSDLKQVEAPLWIEQGRGKPTLMLFSAVDDRSGAVYDEYRCVYGEDAEAALRFLFNAMAPKPEAELPFQGIPTAIYMDNGPVSRSKVFQSVMGSLGVRMLTHMPPSQAERRTPARSKGKVERPFRTIKEVHETLFHFHKPALGLPPVVVGVALYVLLSHSGPLGRLGMLFTPGAMVLAQSLLALPIVTAITHRAVAAIWARYGWDFLALGLKRHQVLHHLLAIGRAEVLTAILAGFGRTVSEVGAILLVGGNIAGYTRTMTTAITLETSEGNLATSLALGLVLILISVAVSGAAFMLSHTRKQAGR